MRVDLHHVFVSFHRNSSSFGIRYLAEVYEFVDKKEEQRILASMSRTQDSVLQFRPVVCSFPLVQCLLQPSLLKLNLLSATLQCN